MKYVTLKSLYKDYERKPGFSMLLSGVPGSGKTTWLTKLALDVPGTVMPRMISEIDLVEKFRDRNFERDLCKELVKSQWTSNFLGHFLLDDFGYYKDVKHYGETQPVTDLIINSLYECWRDLQTLQRPHHIIITTNLLEDELKSIMNPRSYSRLLEMCPHYFVNQKDIRSRLAKERELIK
jgi:DNA replication protein DnaC